MEQAGTVTNLDNHLTLLAEIVHGYNNAEYSTVQYRVRDAERSIRYHKEQAAKAKITLKEQKDILKKYQKGILKATHIKKLLDELKKHKDIDFAFLTDKLELVVQTKPLTQFDALLDKNIDEPVGRYAFCISLKSPTSIYVAALDFECQGYRHPNIMSQPTNTCWGNADKDIIRSIKKGQFFFAISAMIDFFQTFPQDSRMHKPIYWEAWLANRRHSFMQNPWIEKAKTAIYIIGEPLPAKSKRYKITRQKTAMYYGEEVKLAGLKFRQY